MSRKKAIKSVSLLWLGSLFGSGSTFIIYIILARELGADNFGLLGSSLSTIVIFTLLSGFGISQFWLKIFGQEGWSAVRWIKPSLRFVLFTIFLTLSVFIIWIFLGPNDLKTQNILLILIVFMLAQLSVALVGSKLQLEEKYTTLALWQLGSNLLRLIIISLLVYIFHYKLSVIEVAYIYASVGLLYIILGIYQLILFSKGKFKLVGHKKIKDKLNTIPSVKDIFSETWAFGMASVFAFVYVQSDIIMVKYISGNTEAGYYNISFVIMTAIMILPTVLFSKFLLPKYHRWANHDRKKFYQAYKQGNIAMFLAGTFIMIVLYLLSDWSVPLVFGDEYVNAIILVDVLAYTIPIYFVAYSVGATLVTAKHMRLKVILMGSVALINIFLNSLLIPIYNAYGAAIATLISNILLLIMYFIAAEKKVFKFEKENYVDKN